MFGKIPPTFPNEHSIQKDSAYLLDPSRYAETAYLSTHFSVMLGNLVFKRKLAYKTE